MSLESTLYFREMNKKKRKKNKYNKKEEVEKRRKRKSWGGKEKGRAEGGKRRRERRILKIVFVRLDSIKYSNLHVCEKFDYWDGPIINGAKELKFLYKTASTNTN